MSDYASKAKGLIWIIVACVLGTLFAFGISPLARAIPWTWEETLARALSSDSPNQACKSNPEAQALLNQLVKRIYPMEPDDNSFSVDIQVVHNPVINAYAELGGKISLNSGLLKQAESPEEIAGVLSHEIGHVARRHILEGFIVRMISIQGISIILSGNPSSIHWSNYFLNLHFSRQHEAEADEEGLERLQKAHVDNRGFKHFFERMEESESASPFISDHPSNHDRMAMIERFDNHDVTPIMTGAEWKILKNYCSEK